jgi:hypothetical protein
MIQALGDPYSAYLTSDEYRQSLLGISGQFEGIGAEIATRRRTAREGCTPLGPPAASSSPSRSPGRRPRSGRQGRRRRASVDGRSSTG